MTKPWGRLASFGLGFIALLAGQMAALAALAWWLDASLGGMPDFGGDGVEVIGLPRLPGGLTQHPAFAQIAALL